MRNLKKITIFFYTIPFAYLTLISLTLSCESSQKEKPTEILSEKKMTEVIVGLNLADALISSGKERGLKNDKETKFNVFKECRVDRKQYYESLKYYSNRPETLQEIYKNAIDSINRMKQ